MKKYLTAAAAALAIAALVACFNVPAMATALRTLVLTTLTATTITTSDITATDDLVVSDDATITDNLLAANLAISTNVLTSMTEHIVAENASSTITVITAAASQTAELLKIRDSSLNTLIKVTPNGRLALWSRTKAQFDALTPDVIGELVYCSDCSVKNVCIATGTAVSQWMRQDLSTAGCGTGN